MSNLRFETRPQVVASDPNRADVACFVGFVRRRPGPLSAPVAAWLTERGWLADSESAPYARAGAADLLDVPVPIDTWDVFDRHFTWDERPVTARESEAEREEATSDTYLGAAVRSFFAQGGRKCYVVPVGDPLPHSADRDDRLAALPLLLPGYRNAEEAGVPPSLAVSSVDPESWAGVGHLFGLPDVALLCLPDLPDLVRADREPPRDEPPVRAEPVRFVECSEPRLAPPPDDLAHRLRAPRADAAGYREWARAIVVATNHLARYHRESQLVAAVPLPHGDATAHEGLETHLLTPLANAADRAAPGTPDRPPSAFLQLVYPWVQSPGSDRLPQRLECPDGVLTGLLAANALGRGTFRSAAGLGTGDVRALEPELTPEERQRDPGLERRVCLFATTPSGRRLLSDVTACADEVYRPGGVSRLISALLRAARRLGEDVTFEANGERLWGRVRRRLSDLLLSLFELGALRGASPAEAFDVRCDRSTMSQNDIDNGRVLARVSFAPSHPIERITVVLALDEGGGASLAALTRDRQDAA